MAQGAQAARNRGALKQLRDELQASSFDRPVLASARHRSEAPTRRRGEDTSTTAPPWLGFRGSARAHRGTTPRASGSLPAPKRVPAREHHSAAETWDSRRDRGTRPCGSQPHAAMPAWWCSQNAATEQLTMLQRRVLTAVTCIAAAHAFVAPSRSVARPSSSHAQPTTPAAMRQQTYACSARIKTSRHISNDVQIPRRRRDHNSAAAAPDSLVDAQAIKHGYPWRQRRGRELCGNQPVS